MVTFDVYTCRKIDISQSNQRYNPRLYHTQSLKHKLLSKAAHMLDVQNKGTKLVDDLFVNNFVINGF